MNRVFLKMALLVVLFHPLHVNGSLVSVELEDIDSGLTSPAGHYRWMDVANQLYAEDYQDGYDYTQATVTVDFFDCDTVLRGTLTASNLKPNFAYQFKLVGNSETYPDSNERIGLTGRWWQESWNGTAWAGGGNLNDKGSGSSPNPNDLTYYARRDISDPTSPTGKRYRYSAYLVFDYFITDESGSAVLDFQADDSHHVLWKTSQRAPGAYDGPTRTRTFQVTLPDPVGAYSTAHGETTVGIFGEWERLPPGAVMLPLGNYTADFFLTEESFHGGGLEGGWAAAMGKEVTFNIVSEAAARAFYWDALDHGNWGDIDAGTGNSRWLNTCGQPVPHLPNATNNVVVRADTVTVTADRLANTLAIEGGGVVIDSTGTLAVTEAVDVAQGAALDVAGTLYAPSLTTAGTTNFAEGSLGTIDTINVTAGTATMSSPNVNTVNATGGILNIAADVVQLNVADAAVNVSAEMTAKNVNLAGGTIRVNQNSHLHMTGMEISDGTLDASGDVTAESVSMTGGSIYLADRADLNVTTMHVTGGALNTGGGDVVVGSTLKIGKHTTYSITGATFRVNGSNLADPAGPGQLTLGGGSVTIREGPAAAVGAIALWKFEDQGPLTTGDLSTAGNDHVGTLINASRETGDPDHPTALRFGGDGYLEAANTEDLQLGKPFTIAMWIKTSENGVALLGKGLGDLRWRPAEKALVIAGNSGRVSFMGRYCGSMSGLTNVADDEWHHVVVTFATSDDQEIYVDGAKDTDLLIFPPYAGVLDFGAFFRLGWAETKKDGENPVYQEYDGLMDNVYVYDKSLSEAEVSDLYDYEVFGGGGVSLPNMHVGVTDDSVLCFDATSGEAVLGNLVLDGGKKLEIRGAAVQFRDVIAGNGSSIQGDLSVAGTLLPGDSPGTLNVAGGLAMEANSTYQWELGASANDLVEVDPGVLLLETGWKLQLHALGGRAVQADEKLYLFTFGKHGSLDGSSDLAMDREDAIELLGDDWDPGNESWHPTLDKDITGVYISGVVAVPEPGTLALLGLGGLCLLGWRRCGGWRRGWLHGSH